VEWRGVTPRGVVRAQGAAKVAAQAKGGASHGAGLGAVIRPVTAAGAPGVLLIVDGRPVSVITFTVQNGLITQMTSVADPGRLAQIIPSWAL
jgi:RNA polymerase sigma-70 factor (ECF subfamily)